jgi:hypothetical protein
MSNGIFTPSEIDVSKIEMGPIKLLDSGAKTINVRYSGRNLRVEAPSLNIPYGVNIYDKNGPDKLKYSVDLSLRGADDNEQIRALQEFLTNFDEQMITAGLENAGKWFKKPAATRENIADYYTPVVKVSRDADGNPKPYPPTFKINLRKKKDGQFEGDFYNGTERDEKGQIASFPRDTPLEEIFPKRGNATIIFECSGVWLADKRFGTTWKIFQARTDTAAEIIRGPAFKSDVPDIRSFTSKAAVAAPRSNVIADEFEGDEEEDIVAAVMPPAKKAVDAPTFKEDEVVEATAVPKKTTTVKKIVKKV